MKRQIEMMRKHRDVLVALLARDGDDLSQPEREALEHAIKSYTEGADMLEQRWLMD